VLLLSLIMLYSWRQAPAGEAARHALGLKYIGLYGGACALMCVLQSLALLFHVGTDYAVKKYVYALHTALLLELFGAVIAPGGAGVVISSQSGHRLGALSAEQDRALALTPTEELLALPLLQPSQVRDTCTLINCPSAATRCA